MYFFCLFFRNAQGGDEKEERRIQCIFKSESGETDGSPFELPVDISKDKLQLVCDAVIKNVWSSSFSPYFYTFRFLFLKPTFFFYHAFIILF